MRGLYGVALLLLTGCTNNAAIVCGEGEAVVIRDAEAWREYVSAARLADVGYQRDNPSDRNNFVSPLIIVPGYDLDAPHMHWFADSDVRIDSRPRESNVTISQDRKTIAVLRNYIWRAQDTPYQCVTEYRELYGIRRDALE